MSSHEPDSPSENNKSLDEILQEIGEDAAPDERIDPNDILTMPAPGIHPYPEAFATSIEAYRQDPDWSSEKLESVLQLLRKTIARGYDAEAAVNLYRSMAEPTLPKKG